MNVNPIFFITVPALLTIAVFVLYLFTFVPIFRENAFTDDPNKTKGRLKISDGLCFNKSLFVGVQIKINQACSGAVVFLHFGLAGQFGKNGFGQLFAEFYTPLVKAVDAPNNALNESLCSYMAIRLPILRGVDFVHEDEVGWTVAGEGFVCGTSSSIRSASMPWA